MTTAQLLNSVFIKYAEPTVAPKAPTAPTGGLSKPAGGGLGATPAAARQPLTNNDFKRFYSSPEGHVPGMVFRSSPDGTTSFDVSGGIKNISNAPQTQPSTPLVSQNTSPSLGRPALAQPAPTQPATPGPQPSTPDRKSTRLNSSHSSVSRMPSSA